MTYPPFVILKLPVSDAAALAPLVQDCLAAGVKLIAVWGVDAARIEAAIDDLIVDAAGFIATTAHEVHDDPHDLAAAYGIPVVISL